MELGEGGIPLAALALSRWGVVQSEECSLMTSSSRSVSGSSPYENDVLDGLKPKTARRVAPGCIPCFAERAGFVNIVQSSIG